MHRSLFVAGLVVLTQACSMHSEGRFHRQSSLNPLALPPTMAWYGDSIIEGSCQELSPPAVLAQLLNPSWSVSNHGVGGEAASQIRKRYESTRDSACEGEACGWYLIQGGVNSVKGEPHCSPEAALEDMVAMVDDARARGRHVVWFGILPFKGCTLCEDTTAGVARAQEYNALMAQVCAARADISCVLLYSEFEDPARPDFLKPEYGCDGIHLNQVGAERLAAQVRSLVPP